MNRNLLTAALSGLLLLTISSPSFAARVWLFKSVHVEEVAVVNVGGTHAVRIALSDVSGTQSYSCAPTQESGVVSLWGSSVTATMSALLSTALAAQAQGVKVDVLVEDSSCNTGNTWDNGSGKPTGLGLNLNGIRVLRD